MSPPDMITISKNDGQATMNNAYDDSFDENEVDNGDGLLGQSQSQRRHNNNDKDDDDYEKKGKKVAAEVLPSFFGLNLNDSSSEKEREREKAEVEEFYRDQESSNKNDNSSNNKIDTTGNLCWTLYRQANQVRRFQDKSMKLMGIIESLQKENTSLLEQVQNLQTQLKLLMNEKSKTKKLKKSKHNNNSKSESALFYGVCDESSFDSDSDDSENYNFGSTNTNTSDDDESSCMSSLSSDEGHSRSARSPTSRSLQRTQRRKRRESLGDKLTNLRVDLERDESQFFKSEVERLNQLRQRDQSNFERENKKLLEKISTMEKEMSAHYKAHNEDQLRKQKSLYEKKIKEILLQQQTQKQIKTTRNNEPKSIMRRSRSSSIEATSKGGVLPPFIFSDLTIESSLQLHDFWINDTLLFEREGDTNNDISTKEKFIATASLDKTIKITSLLQNNNEKDKNQNQNNKNNNENQNTVFTVVKTIKAHKHRVMSIVMTEIDGQNVIASASWDKTIRFWNCTNTRNTFNHIATLKTSEKAHRLVPFFLQQHHPQQQSIQQSSHSAKSAAHASGGKHMLACALYNGTIEIWDVQAFRKVEMLSHGHSHCIMALDVFEYKSILYLVSGDIMKKLNVWRLSSPLDPSNKKNNDDGWGVSKKKNNNHKLIKTLSKRGGITSVCTFPFYLDDEEEDEQDEGGSTSHCKDVIIAACKKRDVVLYRMSNYEVYHRFDFEKDCIFAIKPFVIRGGAGVGSGTRRRMLATTSDKGWLRVIDVKKKTLVYKFQCDDLRFSFLYLLNDCHNVITKKTTTRRRSSIDKNHKKDSKQQQLKHQDVVFVSGGKDKQTEKGTLVMLKIN